MSFAPENDPPSVKLGGTILRGIRLRHLAWLALLYAAWLWWIHYLVRTPLNIEYFKLYVSLRCTAAQTARFPQPRSREDLIELNEALRRCQGINVKVDGVWGGSLRKPSVRLKILHDDGARSEFKYYSVDVSPVLGTASIQYELSPALYYLNP